MSKLHKLQIKVQKANDFEWNHLCYIPRDLRNEFERNVNIHKLLMNYWIALWAMNEFGLEEIDTEEGLMILRGLIKLKYKNLYPDIFLETNTDKQGWVRVWVVENMKLELKQIGK